MEDTDLILIGITLLGLGAASILTARVLKIHENAIIAHGEDISMIKAVLKTMDGADR